MRPNFPKPKLFSETETETLQKLAKVSTPRSFETKRSISAIHITYTCHHRDKISNTIELFREVTHPLAKGEEAGKIFAKYEQLYAGLAM